MSICKGLLLCAFHPPDAQWSCDNAFLMYTAHRHMCKHRNDTLHRAKCYMCLQGDDKTLRLGLITTINAAVICITRRLGFHQKKKKKGALDVVPSAKVTHDGLSLSRSLSSCLSLPSLGYLRHGEEAHSQEKMA